MGLFLALAIVLFILWILGFATFHIAGALIHILLIAAVISLLIWIIRMAVGGPPRTV
jgi:hypothetical protein